MYCSIFKHSQTDYTIIDVYFKGRWDSDRDSIIVYLSLLEMMNKGDKTSKKIFPGDPDFIDWARKQGHINKYFKNFSDKFITDVLDFIRTERMPTSANFRPNITIKNIDSYDNGIITPSTPIVEVTPLCNYQCPWCYIPPRKELKNSFSLEQYENNIVKPLVEYFGLSEWCLTGGEPSIDPERTVSMANIINNASQDLLGERAKSIYLLTNGYNLKENITRFYKAGINCYQVAISSPHDEKDSFLRKTPSKNPVQRAIEGIKAAKNMGARVEINMIIQPKNDSEISNMDDIADMINLSSDLRIDMLRLIPAVPCGRASENEIFFSKKEYKEISEIVKAHMHKLQNIRLDCPMVQEIEDDRSVYCRAGTLWVYINFKGEIFPCNNLQGEDHLCWDSTIKDNSISEIWLKSELLNSLRDYNKESLSEDCIGCKDRMYCCGECRSICYARYRKYDLSSKPDICVRKYGDAQRIGQIGA
jgi:radical SAM protein with 4Fe4S-binding SPASM domain